MMKEEFIAEIDGNLEKLGYGDRASLIRDAIIEKMTKLGIKVPTELSAARPAPGRVGSQARYESKKEPKRTQSKRSEDESVKRRRMARL